MTKPRKLKKSEADIMVWHGIRFLNENAPEVLSGISAQALNLATENACVLGQGFGTYSVGREELGLTSAEAEKFGFFLTSIYGAYTYGTYINSPEMLSQNYSILTEAWLRGLNGDDIKFREKLKSETADLLVWHGARLLQESDNSNVLDSLNTYTLDLGNSTVCVLGQGWGFYGKGREALNLTHEEAVMYGFDMGSYWPVQAENYSVLTEAWLRYIKQRRRSLDSL